ncbi:MAG: hypothetical protein IJB96_03900 [Lachnospira sp.]|nr:hypothetical protein [Lachnospira sp.]
MYKMIEFIKSEVFVIILTVISLTCTRYPLWLLLVASLVVILFCVRSLEEDNAFKTRSAMWWVQLALFFIFCLLAGEWFSYLIFSESNTRKFKWDNVLVPSVLYVVVSLISQRGGLAIHLLYMILLLVIAAVMQGMQLGLRTYMEAQSKVGNVVKVSALNELYQRKLNQELTLKNFLADKNARLEERENISRNIHNSVGHSITAAIMTLDAADMIYDVKPELARERMHVAQDRIKGSLESIRHAVRMLDKEAESISCDDFEKTLLTVADEFAMDTSIKIRTTFTRIADSVQIPHEHVEFLTGALQELLTNGVKHGNADVFDVQVISDSSHIKLSVKDNGKSGFNDENRDIKIKNGFGLKKIDSYVRSCGGEMAVTAVEGFRCEITLPLLKEEKDG